MLNCRKKKQEVAKPIKPEEEETIGEKYADLSSLKQKGKGESAWSLLSMLVYCDTGLESRLVSSGSYQMPSPRHVALDGDDPNSGGT